MREREGENEARESSLFYNLISEDKQGHLFHILLVTESSFSTVWRGLHEGVNTRGMDRLELSWSLAISLSSGPQSFMFF